MEKFILKNGTEVLIRKLQLSDYEQVIDYLKKISTETVFLNQYPGQPDMPIEKAKKAYENENSVFYGAFLSDGTLIGSVSLVMGEKGFWHCVLCEYVRFLVETFKNRRTCGLLYYT